MSRIKTRKCAQCGKPFTVTAKLRTDNNGARFPKRKTCSRTCAVALSWRNPETAKTRSAGIRKSKATPEAQAWQIEHNQKRWSREGERDRLSEQNRQRWADPVFRKKLSAAIRTSHNKPEARARFSKIMRAMWNDPGKREQWIANIRAAKSSPNARAAFSAALRERWKDPIWRVKFRSAGHDALGRRRKGHKAGVGIRSANDLLRVVDRGIPRGLPDYVRDDIAQEVLLALLEDTIQLCDLATGIKTYSRKYWSMFPGKFGPISLDAPIPGTDGLALIDTIADDAVHA